MLVTPVASGEVPPDLLLKALTTEVTTIVKRSRDEPNLRRDSEVNEFVERRIVPLFDFDRMTQIAVGRNWYAATPDQRSALVSQFKTLLVRTYSTVLLTYGDAVIEYKAVIVEPGSAGVAVNSVVRRPGASGAPITYDMAKTAAGWKVYEISVEGVKLIENYRSTFAARVNEGGVDGLIKALSDKNRESVYSGASPRPAVPASPG
jgi:phospholipid transport system substrate-binding protein